MRPVAAPGRYRQHHLAETHRAALEAVDLADAELGADQNHSLQVGLLRRRDKIRSAI